MFVLIHTFGSSRGLGCCVGVVLRTQYVKSKQTNKQTNNNNKPSNWRLFIDYVSSL